MKMISKDNIMKAFIVKRYGKKEKLHLTEIAEPVVKENDVLVQVHSAGVNLLDSKIRNGEFKLILSYKTPFTLGHDVAGIVTKVGSKVRKFKVGDEVYARPADHRIGTFAEYISINENDLALKPKNLSVEEANLQKGQKVFIQAGSGGVGTFAIQLAKYLGATVATTTSAANFDLVKGLGADIVIDYRKEDFETILKDYDVVLNSQDTKTLEKSLRILKPGGKLISISGPPDPNFAKEIGLSWMLKVVLSLLSYKVRKAAKQQRVSYSFLFMNANGNQLSRIASLIDAGIIRPVIDKVFSFEDTNDALTYVETARAKGKVVIKVK
jgi:NADPH:quinone reductase-like Zn-dependent oxidoreductase